MSRLKNQTLINGWPADPLERSREMRRRQAVAARRHKHGTPGKYGPAVLAGIAEYKALRRFDKQAWREGHNISTNQVSMVVRGIATDPIASRCASKELIVRPPDPIPTVHLVPVEVPAGAPVTSEDMIEAFKVKRDHLNEFIGWMETMQRGARV